jgi:hypothetical protein
MIQWPRIHYYCEETQEENERKLAKCNTCNVGNGMKYRYLYTAQQGSIHKFKSSLLTNNVARDRDRE